MSENNTNRNIRDDEIDLHDLFKRMSSTLSRLGNSLGRALLISFVFLLRRWIPLLISVLAGVGISYLLKVSSVSFYTSDLVFRNNLALMDAKTSRDITGTTAELISKLNKLHTFCLEKNKAALSEALSLIPDAVKNISDISAYWIIDQSRDGIPDFVDYRGNHSAYDTINIRMQDRLNIRAKINSAQNLNILSIAITKFIENDSLYRQRNRLRMIQNQDLLLRLNYDILQLDSLQKVKYFVETRNIKPNSGGQIIFMQEQKTQLLYNDIYSLYDRKQRLESERDLYKGVVTVLSDFSLPTKRENGGMYYGRYVIPISFCLTLLILIILANYKKLKEVFNNN